MTTRAGRFRKRISQGSKKRFSSRTRPSAMPMAVPIVIARTKLARTRARVMPILTKREPSSAASTIVAPTRPGPGSKRGSEKYAAPCQTATRTTIDNADQAMRVERLASCFLILGFRYPEQRRVKARPGADQFRSSEVTENSEQSLRGLGLGRSPGCPNARSEVLLQPSELGIGSDAHGRPEPLPRGIVGLEDLVRAGYGAEEARHLFRLGAQKLLTPDE